MGNRVIKYKSGYKHTLHEPYSIATPITPDNVAKIENWITLDTTGLLRINKGYAWDGASGALDTKTIIRGSLVHDALYQLMREGELSSSWIPKANELLHTICIEDGMTWFRAWYVLRAVNLFGSAFASAREPVINTAP